jgi:RND family efflux transporter MFP subunit
MVAAREAKQIYKASGTVRSVVTAPLSSKITGTVLEVRVRAGDWVKAGQLLAVIDSREAKAMVEKSEASTQEAQMALQEIDKNIEAAQANLQLASTTLHRYQELAARKSVSPQEFEEVQTRQRSAAASLEALQARKLQWQAPIQQTQSEIQTSQALQSYAEIRSPLNGVVVQRQAEPGSLALPGIALLTVEEAGRYRLEVPVEESRISQIRIGEGVSVLIEALQASALPGKVSEIQPAADSSSRTYLVKINVPPNSRLCSGMYGEAHFEMGSRKGIWLPPQTIVHQGQLECVYVVERNLARLRLLKLGESTASGVEVQAGLDGGETIVTQGMEGLRDGSRVEVSR